MNTRSGLITLAWLLFAACCTIQIAVPASMILRHEGTLAEGRAYRFRCAPVDPNSTNFINFIGAGTGMHPDFGGDDGSPNGIYGMVYITVPGNIPIHEART